MSKFFTKDNKKWFTFDCGITVEIKQISPMLRGLVSSNVPMPVPPMQKIEVGDGTTVEEPNEAHPDYIKALADRQDIITERLNKLYILRGVIGTPDLPAVADLREFMSGINTKLDDNDFYVWVTNILISSNAEQLALGNAIVGDFQPNEEVIAGTLETFQHNTEG